MSTTSNSTLLKLGQKQEVFTYNVAKLITYAYSKGYRIRLGHALRCQDCPTGRKTSLHKDKLAIDLNLFKDGKYLTTTEDHRFLGLYWEALDQANSWGGHFDDGNHYSMSHHGRR